MPKEVRQIEVDDGNFKRRVILLIVFLVIGIAAIGFGVYHLVTQQDGWQKVEIAAEQQSCSTEFSLEYCFGQGSLSATEEYRKVVGLYTQACRDGYRYFHQEGELAKLNAAPNTPVAVSAPLYGALKQLGQSRHVYLAPMLVEYDRVFLCENEGEAMGYDPGRDPELAAWLLELAAFGNDPQHVSLVLQENNQVVLQVSEAYLAFAREYEITEFVDLGWLRNAFIADHIANVLSDAGLTHGYVASYDGFTRNLDSGSYDQNIFCRTAQGIDKPAVLTYTGPIALVYLRDYPLSDADRWRFYAFSDGSILTNQIDPADGRSKSAVHDLVVYSQEKTCGQLAVAAAEVFVADQLEESGILAWKDSGIYALWCRDHTLCYTQPNAQLKLTDEQYTITPVP